MKAQGHSYQVCCEHGSACQLDCLGFLLISCIKFVCVLHSLEYEVCMVEYLCIVSYYFVCYFVNYFCWLVTLVVILGSRLTSEKNMQV